MIKNLLVRRTFSLQNRLNMFLNLREVIVNFLFFLFLFLVKRIILLSDVFNEFDYSFIVIVIDTVFNLVIMDKCIEVVQK